MATQTFTDLEYALINQVLIHTRAAEPPRSMGGVKVGMAEINIQDWRGQAPRWAETYHLTVSYHVEGQGGPHFAYIPLRGASVDGDGSIRLDVGPDYLDPSGDSVVVTTTAGHQFRAGKTLRGGWLVTIKESRHR